jgi:predicted DNA-binding transcriptional regulator AlpA
MKTRKLKPTYIEAIEGTITSDQFAQALQMSPETLRVWRREGTGPRFIRISKNIVRYRVTDIETWLATRKHRRHPAA